MNNHKQQTNEMKPISEGTTTLEISRADLERIKILKAKLFLKGLDLNTPEIMKLLLVDLKQAEIIITSNYNEGI